MVDSDRENNGEGIAVLDDGTEFLLQTDPTLRDTDGDGLSDFYEHFGLESQDPELAAQLDLDPLVPDLAQTSDEWFGQYVDGYTCGDAYNLCPWLNEANLGTAPFIIGAVASGFGGPIPDARDLIGNISRGEVFGTGVSLIAFVPVFGDSAAGVSRAVRLLKSALEVPTSRKQASRVLQVIEQSDLPGGVADDIIDGVLGAARRTLTNAGMTDEGFDTLRATGGVDFNALAKAVEDALPSSIPSPGFLSTWQRGEQILRESGPTFIDKGKGFADPAIQGGRANFRIVDAWDPINSVALESKVGVQRLSDSLRRQIDRDAALLADGRYVRVEWHFFASGTSGKIADDPKLFEYLTANDIPYVIHLP